MGGKGSGRTRESNQEPDQELEPGILIIGMIELRTAVADLNRHLADIRSDDMKWWARLIRLHDKVGEFKDINNELS